MSKPGDKVVVVDENDTPIGIKLFEDTEYEDIYRVSALWLTDVATGDILLAQRKWTKRHDPGKWTCAVAGTIEEGDTYDSNIVKEIGEEIGLTGLSLTTGPKQFVDDGAHKFFCQWFYASVDKNTTQLTLEEDAVEQVQWLQPAWLLTDVTHHPEKYPPTIVDSLHILGVGATKPRQP
jgi:isopentenyldiphosphate isomerase